MISKTNPYVCALVRFLALDAIVGETRRENVLLFCCFAVAQQLWLLLVLVVSYFLHVNGMCYRLYSYASRHWEVPVAVLSRLLKVVDGLVVVGFAATSGRSGRSTSSYTSTVSTSSYTSSSHSVSCLLLPLCRENLVIHVLLSLSNGIRFTSMP